jgi:hypothetical protein
MTAPVGPLWFLFFFPAMWFGIGALLSYVAGWPGLAARFRATQATDGEHFRFISGSVGASPWFPVSYRSCLFFTVSTAGFRISVFFPFRFLTPPLFIPWPQVESVTEGRFWFVRHVIVRLRGSPIQIKVPGAAGRSISSAYARFLTGSPYGPRPPTA